MGYNSKEEDGFFINRLIRLSKNITELYTELMEAEQYYGKNSDAYQIIVRNIGLSMELEDEMKETLYNNPNLLLLFKRELAYKGDSRNVEILDNDPYASASMYYALKCEEYDKLRDFGRIYCSKEKYLDKTYGQNQRTIAINGALTLLEQKTYVKVLDEEIKNTTDKETIHMLIREKYKTISENPPLASWYFGFPGRDEALLIEDDEVTAALLDVDVEVYKRFKKRYFSKIVDGVEDLVISEEESSKEALKLYKLNLLGALLNLDVIDVNESYLDFFQSVSDNQIPDTTDKVRFVDQVYSEYAKYLKKIKER